MKKIANSYNSYRPFLPAEWKMIRSAFMWREGDWFQIWRSTRNDFRPVMEKAGFKHLQFQRTVVFGEGAERNGEEPIWELTSDLQMPPMAPSVRFCEEEGNPVDVPLKGRRITTVFTRRRNATTPAVPSRCWVNSMLLALGKECTRIIKTIP